MAKPIGASSRRCFSARGRVAPGGRRFRRRRVERTLTGGNGSSALQRPCIAVGFFHRLVNLGTRQTLRNKVRKPRMPLPHHSNRIDSAANDVFHNFLVVSLRERIGKAASPTPPLESEKRAQRAEHADLPELQSFVAYAIKSCTLRSTSSPHEGLRPPFLKASG